MATTLGSVTLPADLEWIDEYGWLPVSQATEVSTGGSLIVEEFVQAKGRPITLAARQQEDGTFVWTDRATIDSLRALAATPLASPLTLTLEDGRTFSVRFRYTDGIAVEATPVQHVAPHADADPYILTLRLMEVA